VQHVAIPTLAGVPVLRDAIGLRQWCAAQRRQGLTIALVPTMGALHEGHLQLVDCARQHADRVVVTVFVNPLQFAAHEDLDRYPRKLAQDCAACASRQVALVFAPDAAAMYPPGFQTHVEVEGVQQGWCGASRPGHLRGVATVVTKLLNLVMADVAVFGEKDWQQLQVIRRLARDLDHPTRILGAPTVREADGLAMSSRNVYLSADERLRALAIPRGLARLQADVAAGERRSEALLAPLRAGIVAAGGRLDYAGLAAAESLQPLEVLDQPARVLVAAFFGQTRLIDNTGVTPWL
jgi:pantoate--beta-alanine ligase